MQNIVRRAILAIALIAGLTPAIAQAPPPVPGLPDTERRTAYSISASTCACSVGFALYGDSTDYQNWVEVFINGVQVNYNDPVFGWTITSPTGPLASIPRPVTDGVLTFTSAQTGTIQIVGARRPRRVSQFNENTGVPARNLNQVFTDIVAMLREDWDKINDVTGRVVRAPPGETMTTLPPAASRANQGVCFDGAGNIVPCVLTSSGAIAAGNGISLSGTNPVTITNNIAAASPIVITGTNPKTIGCPTCSTFVPPVTNTTYVASRAAAIALNLSTSAVITTGGYGAAGDGGGATFKNVGTASFIDSDISTYTIAGGSGYTNGTYLNVQFSGGHGIACFGQAVVTGGVVTSVFHDQNCPGFQVGDVLTTPNSQLGGAGGGFALTVTALIGPLGSFTDAAGNHFQIVTNEGTFPNVLQFGCVPDWNGTDAGATNNRNCFISAISFANYPFTSSTAGVNGNVLLMPKGAYMLCGDNGFASLTVPQGVTLRGAGIGGTTLHFCDATNQNVHLISICTNLTTRGQFGCKIENFTLHAINAPAASTSYAVYSSSGQQFPLMDTVLINPGVRGCLLYEKGTGGAANAIFSHIDCEGSGSTSANRVTIASGLGQTQVKLLDWVIECSALCSAVSGINISGGNPIIDTVNFENIVSGIFVNNTLPTSIMNITPGSGCVNLITLTAANPNGFAVVGNIASGGCTTTVNNVHSGGSSVTGNILAPRVFSP